MKKILASIALTAFLAAPLFAADAEKEVTITGEGKCAKCALKETDKCQNAIQVKENGKLVTYYVADNKESKAFHSSICKEAHKVTATGKVKEENGKKILTVSKIELAK